MEFNAIFNITSVIWRRSYDLDTELGCMLRLLFSSFQYFQYLSVTFQLLSDHGSLACLVWRVPCSLHIKDHYCEFEKEYTHCSLYKRLHFSFLPNSLKFSSANQKSLSCWSRFSFSLLRNYYIKLNILFLNMREICAIGGKATNKF